MKKGLLKMVVLSMLVALGVVISPILRVEGMCPMAHFINIVCSVFLGTMVFTSLCNTDRNYQNDNNGYSAVSTYRSSIRGIFVGSFLQNIKGKA